MKEARPSGPEIVYVDEKELLEGLLQITDGRLGAAHSLLDRVIQKSREEVETTYREIKANVAVELRRARRRAQYRLQRSMDAHAGAKPRDMALHHLVACGDRRAERALRILLQFDIDPHSAVNGVYLPRSVQHTPHLSMPSAPAHSMIHTEIYYNNVFYVLREAANISGATKDNIEKVLYEIAQSLQTGTFPIDEKMERV